MGLQGEIATENTIQFVVEKIREKIEQHKDHPETVKTLKELGIEVLDSLPRIPEWAQAHYKLFRE